MKCSIVNPLSVNPTKWSDTLQPFVGNSRIVWVCLTILRIKTKYGRTMMNQKPIVIGCIPHDSF